MLFFKKILPVLCLVAFCLLPVRSQAFFSPDLEKFTAADINEMLQSTRAKSKSDIKRLMEWGYVVKGGDAPSGLKLVKFEEWRPTLYRQKSFGVHNNTFELSDFNSVSYWDLASHELKEVIVCEDSKYSIVGNAPGTPVLVIGKYEKKAGDNALLVSFVSVDKGSLKKKKELGSLTLWGEKDDFRRDTGLWAIADYATSADGSLFMVTSHQGKYLVSETQTGKRRAFSSTAHAVGKQTGPVNQFSPDGTKFFTTLGDKKRAVFDARNGKLLAEVPQLYHTPCFSPDGKYLTVGKAFMTADGKKKLFDMARPSTVFLPKTDYIIDYYLNGIIYRLIEKDGLLQLSVQGYDRLAKYLREAVVSRDGKQLFVAFDETLNFVGVSGGYKFQVITVNKPSDKTVKLTADAERAIELYKAGLTKQGLSRMRKLIAQDPAGLWFKDYDQKIYKAGLPLILNSELLIPLIRQQTEKLKSGNKPGSVIAIQYNTYMLYALAAKQPTAAMQAYLSLSRGSKDGTINLTPKVGGDCS